MAQVNFLHNCDNKTARLSVTPSSDRKNETTVTNQNAVSMTGNLTRSANCKRVYYYSLDSTENEAAKNYLLNVITMIAFH